MIKKTLHRNRQIRIPVYALLLWMGSYNAHAQRDTLALSEAIALAQENALEVKKRFMEYRVAQSNVQYNRAMFKPQMGISTTLPNFYKSTSAITQPDGTIHFLPISQDNSQLNLSIQQRVLSTNTLVFAESGVRRYRDFTGQGFKNFNTVPVRVGIEQPLNGFNSLKWEKRILEVEEEVAKARLAMLREEMAVQVTAVFFDLLAAQVNLEIALTNAHNNQKIFEIALERERLGKLSKSDLLQLELGLNSARQSEINARREVIRANAALKKVMGWGTHTDGILVLRIPAEIGSRSVDPAEAAELAWERRPEEKELKKRLYEAERALADVRAKHSWQGSLSATVGWVGTGAQWGHTYRTPQAENHVQVALSIPIVDGGRRKISMAAARDQHQYAEEELAFSELTFKQEVRQLVLQHRELAGEVRLGEKSLAIARERYEIANQRYLLNNISITELSIAFNERDQAWRNYMGLLRAYWTTYQTLRQLTMIPF